MPIVVGLTKADSQNLTMQLPVEIFQNVNRAAFAHANWFATERIFQRGERGAGTGAAGVSQERRRIMAGIQGEPDRFRREPAEMLHDKPVNGFWPGTSRQVILATAQAGTMVFPPRP